MTQTPLTYKVELDVSGGAFGSAFVATNVTTKAVAGLGFEPTTVTWGRQDEYSDVTPTTVSGLLQNSDGTFSPGNASGTYYPRIRRGLRRRVSVGVNATTVNLSEDYATSIEVQPANEGPATTSLEGADILTRFGTVTPLRSFLAEEMLVDNPSCLYMLQEDDGATSFGDVTGKQLPVVLTNSKYGGGTVTAGQTPTNTFYGGTVVTVNNPTYVSGAAGGSWIGGTTPDLSGTTAYSIEAWVVAPSAASTFQAQILQADNEDVAAGFTLPITSLPRFIVQDGTHVDASTTFLDARLHQLVGVVNGATATFYIDGVSIGSAACSVLAGPAPSRFALGMNNNTRGGHLAYSGGYAYAAIYPTALSAARVLAHYQAGVTTFAGERTDQRVSRLLTYRANTGSSLDTGLGTMGVQDIAGRTLQDCLFEVAQTEGGIVFADGTGRTNFRSRSRLFNPTPTVTLDMKVGGVDFGSNWREDTQNVINDATVTNTTTGSEQRNFSASSITADGEYATSLQLPLNADTDAANMAGWIVANGTQANLTATPLVINLLHLTPAQAQAVLQLKPLDCIQLTNCPIPAPAATQTFIVQGGSTSLAADAASVTLNVTPLPYPVGVWDSTKWDAAGVTWSF